MSMIICPNCDKENPADRYYCDFCGYRLVAPDVPDEEQDESEEQPDSSGPNPFDLPSRQPGETGDLDLDNIPDWLRTGEHQIPTEGTSAGSDSDWLSDLEDITFNVGQGDEVDDWLDVSLPELEEPQADPASATPDIDEPLPDLDEPLPEQNLSGADELLQWQDGTDLDGAELPDWLAADESGELAADPDEPSSEPTLTSWLDEELVGDEPPVDSERVVSDLGGLTSFLAELDEAAPAPPDDALDDSPLDLLDPMPADAEIEAFRLGTSDLGEPTPAADESVATEDYLEDLGEFDVGGEEPALADAELEAFNIFDADVGTDIPDESLTENEPEHEAEAPSAEQDFTFDLEQDLPAEFAVDSLEMNETEGQADEDLDLAGFTSWLSELQETVQDPALSQDINQADLITDPNIDIPTDAEGEALPEEFLDELARAEAEDDVIDGNSNLPDWLAEIRPDDTSILPSPDDEDDERISPVADAIPDWLADISPDSLPEADDSFGLSDDWLADVVPGAAEETILPPTEAESGEPIVDLEADIAADWLDELAEAGDRADPDGTTIEDYRDTIVVPPPSRPDTGQLEGVPEELAGADLPDWLSGATIAESAPSTPSDRSATPLDNDFLNQDDISYEEMPDWLQPEQTDFDTALDAALAVQGSEMVSAMGGEWAAMLAELPDAAEDEPEEPIQLEAAEIPEWLQKLKPDENAPHEVAEPEEVTGVLAGVRGVIDVEPVIALPRQAEQLKEVAVTDQEQQQAALLRQVAIAERAQIIHLGAQRARAIPVWARLLLAVLLIAALLASQLAPVQNLVDELLTPPPVPAESSAALDLLAGINNQTVLVAVEYTPAMQGELDALARPLLAQLAAQGNRFVLVSQYPAGVPIARQLTDELDTTELGYLPGEAVGLRQLSSCLSKAACAGLEAAAGDIGLILLLTSERTSLQNWVEQVAAVNEAIPLIAALPELLSPLAAPYLQTGQIDGALSGAQSGAAATGDAALVDLARSQTVAIWLVIVLLLLSNLIALFGGRRRAATASTAPRQVDEAAASEEDELP